MSRYAVFAIVALSFLVAVAMVVLGMHGWIIPAVALGALTAVGVWDMVQTRSTLRRNYPLTAHIRYGLESFGP